jgi:hypothetical protein
VHEHVLTAIVTDDEAEALLRIEEFDDAFAFADDLGRHSATTTTAAAAETAAAAAAATATEATASAAVTAAAATTVAAATAAAVTESTTAVAVATALLESATAEITTTSEIVFAETIAFVATAPSALAFTPSVETHARPNFLCALIQTEPTRWAPGATGRCDSHTRTERLLTGKNRAALVIP